MRSMFTASTRNQEIFLCALKHAVQRARACVPVGVASTEQRTLVTFSATCWNTESPRPSHRKVSRSVSILSVNQTLLTLLLDTD